MAENPYESPVSSSDAICRVRLTPGKVFIWVAFGFVAFNVAILCLHRLFPESGIGQVLGLANLPGMPVLALGMEWHTPPQGHYYSPETLYATIFTSAMIWAGTAALIVKFTRGLQTN